MHSEKGCRKCETLENVAKKALSHVDVVKVGRSDDAALCSLRPCYHTAKKVIEGGDEMVRTRSRISARRCMVAVPC